MLNLKKPGVVGDVLKKREFNFLAVACGGGRNMAMLIGMYEKGIRPDVITLADTGSTEGDPTRRDGEKPETYAVLDEFSDWCEERFDCPIRRVYKRSKYKSLYDNCLQTKTLPSAAYGLRSCSDKWKIQPQERFMNNYAPVVAIWNVCQNCGKDKKTGHVAKFSKPMTGEGKRKLVRFCRTDNPVFDIHEPTTFFYPTAITKAIGYHAGEQSRIDKAHDDEKYKLWFPLMEWGWYTEECIAAFKRHGLTVPIKSACYFCPSSTKEEVVWLHDNHPDLFARAVALEDNAEDLRTVKGLGRHWTWKELMQIAPADRKALPNPSKMNCVCLDTED